MSYTSTIAAAKSSLRDLLDAALTIPVLYAWNPGETTEHAVFLTKPPGLDAAPTSSVPAGLTTTVMQPGAQPFNEVYRIDLTVWSFRPDLSSDGAETCETQVCTTVGSVLDVLADNPSLGNNVMWALPDDNGTNELAAYERGWVCTRTIPIEVTARLQP